VKSDFCLSILIHILLLHFGIFCHDLINRYGISVSQMTTHMFCLS